MGIKLFFLRDVSIKYVMHDILDRNAYAARSSVRSDATVFLSPSATPRNSIAF